MSDGQIKIDTLLDSSKAKKGLQEIEKAADSTGKKITQSMNEAEKAMNKASNGFDGAKIAKQLKNVENSIDNTNKKITDQKKKLEELKQSYDKAGNQKMKDNISAQIEKTTANIEKLETKLNGFKDKQINLKVKMDSINDLDGEFHSASMKITEDLDKVEKKAEETGKKINNYLRVGPSLADTGESIKKIGDSITGVGNTLTTHVTLPIVGAGIAAGKVGLDFGAQMSRVKAISGATGEEFKQLHDTALQLGSDTAFSAKQAAEGMEKLASAGFSTNETIQAMPGLLNLAASSGESLASSSDIAASTLRGFGLAASDTAHVADVLAKNASATNAAVADTGEAMKYIAPVAHSMGLGLEEVTAAIGEMANSGIKGSQAGTTLRSALTRLASPADEAKKAMQQIGFNAFDSQGKLKSLSTIVGEYQKALQGKTEQQKQDYTATIFGQEAMSGMLVLMDGGKQGLDDLTNSYKNSTGAADEMAKTMQDNGKSAIEQMTGSLETAAIKVTEDFAPVITEIAKDIQNMADAFAKLSPEQQEFYVKLALGAAAAGPVLKTVGGITSGIGGLIGLLGKFAPAAEGVAEAGAAAAGTGGLGALLPVLGAAASAAAPVILAAAAVGMAYEGMTQQVVPNVDLFADKINVTSKTVQTASGEMQEAVAGSTVKISDATKKAVQSYLDMDNGAKEAIQDLYINNSTITDQITNDTKTKFDSMAKSVISGYEKQKTESIKQLTDLFSKQKDITAQEQAEILEKNSKYYADREAKVQEDEAKINEIIKSAKDNNTSLTAEQVEEITSLQNDMRENAVNALSEQETESSVILQRIKDYDGQMTAEQASEHIKQLNDSRDKAVQAANDEYDQTIATITKMRDETGSITADQATTMIENAKNQRDETVKKAEETRAGAVKKIQDMNKGIEDSVDLSTGNIKTYWNRLVDWWNSWNPPKKTFEYSIAGGSTTVDKSAIDKATYNPYSNYTGSNNPNVGLSTVDEHGYETAKNSNIHMIGTGIARISSHANGGGGIVDHMTTVNEMHNDISNQVNNKLGATVAKLLSSSANQIQELRKITENTGQSADSGIKNIELNEKLASNLVNAFNLKSANNSFFGLNNELTTANTAKENASKMKVDDNTNYSSLKSQVDNLKSSIDDLNTTIDNTTDENTKKQLEAQKKVLNAQQDSAEKEMNLAKMVAENEIQSAKDSAEQQVKIAQEKKDKLVKISEAVTTAIKNQLQEEEAAAEGKINSKLSKLESSYNKKLAELDEQTTETSRNDTTQGYNDKISILKAKMTNTASYADKQAYQLQINDLQKDLNKQEDQWTTEDKKKALQDEYNEQKDTLEKQLKDTKDYYSKLQETDSINAQARYLLLNSNSKELVDLLNSYNPQWQNVGQSLADSLLTGLNSEKQSVQDAVNDLMNIRGSNTSTSNVAYYDEKGNLLKGYASGTNSNPTAGLYKTNEKGFEMNAGGDVAYVSQGAAIKNHMQTQSYIDSLVATEVSNLKASLIQSQQDTIRSMFSGIGGNSNNVVNREGNKVFFNVENYYQNTNQDIEATGNALGHYAFKQETF